MDGDHSDWCSSEKLNHRHKDHQTYQIGTGNTVPRYESWARDSFNLYRKTSSKIPSPVPTHDLVLKSCHRCWWSSDIDQWSHRNGDAPMQLNNVIDDDVRTRPMILHDAMFWSRPTKPQTMRLRYQSTMLNINYATDDDDTLILINDVTHDDDVPILINDATDDDNFSIT